jgi:hypothetical protein
MQEQHMTAIPHAAINDHSQMIVGAFSRTLNDWQVDLGDEAAVITALLHAGYGTARIYEHMDAAIEKALVDRAALSFPAFVAVEALKLAAIIALVIAVWVALPGDADAAVYAPAYTAAANTAAAMYGAFLCSILGGLVLTLLLSLRRPLPPPRGFNL